MKKKYREERKKNLDMIRIRCKEELRGEGRKTRRKTQKRVDTRKYH
jgi:hypothetical protein